MPITDKKEDSPIPQGLMKTEVSLNTEKEVLL